MPTLAPLPKSRIEAARADSLDLPEEEFDYNEFVEREFGKKKSVPRGIPLFWWVVGIVVLVAFIFLWVL